MMTAADLRRCLDTAVVELPADETADAIGLCAAAQARLLARLTAPVAPVTDKLVNAKVMAEILDVPEGWVRDRGRGGQIPTHRLGHHVRFSPRAVLEAVRKLPPLHNPHLRSIKRAAEKRGGKRSASIECPSSVAETAPEAANG
jgi:hypothetical protein